MSKKATAAVLVMYGAYLVSLYYLTKKAMEG